MFSKILKLLHIHYYNKPIASEYVSFHTRDIIYQCRCGKRKLRHEFFAFSEEFPIETKYGAGLGNHKEFMDILK